MEAEKWEGLFYVKNRPDLWCLELVVSGAKLVLAAMVRWHGDKPHGTTLMHLEAHLGLLDVFSRFNETSESHSRTRTEEILAIEEVDFNIKGLSMDCFLPPRDLKKEEEGCDNVVISNGVRLPFKIRSASSRISIFEVAIDATDYSDEIYDENKDR